MLFPNLWRILNHVTKEQINKGTKTNSGPNPTYLMGLSVEENLKGQFTPIFGLVFKFSYQI